MPVTRSAGPAWVAVVVFLAVVAGVWAAVWFTSGGGTPAAPGRHPSSPTVPASAPPTGADGPALSADSADSVDSADSAYSNRLLSTPVNSSSQRTTSPPSSPGNVSRRSAPSRHQYRYGDTEPTPSVNPA